MASLSTCPAFDASDYFYATGVTQASGVVTVPVTSSYSSGWNAYASFDVRNAFISMELALASPGTGTKVVDFSLADSTGKYKLGMTWTGSSLNPYYMVNGTSTAGTAVSIATAVYIKIAENNGVVTWSYSSNGTTWTTLQSIADPFSATYLAALNPNAFGAYYGTESASNATFSNLSVGALTPTVTTTGLFFMFFGRNSAPSGGGGGTDSTYENFSATSQPPASWTPYATS